MCIYLLLLTTSDIPLCRFSAVDLCLSVEFSILVELSHCSQVLSFCTLGTPSIATISLYFCLSPYCSIFSSNKDSKSLLKPFTKYRVGVSNCGGIITSLKYSNKGSMQFSLPISTVNIPKVYLFSKFITKIIYIFFILFLY